MPHAVDPSKIVEHFGELLFSGDPQVAHGLIDCFAQECQIVMPGKGGVAGDFMACPTTVQQG